MKKQYINPEFSISEFVTENIVATSGNATKTISQKSNEKGISSVKTDTTVNIFDFTL